MLIWSIHVELHDIGRMFDTLLDEVKQWRKVLLSSMDIDEHIILPDIITDDVNTILGFYFGATEQNGLKGYEDLLFKLTLDNPKLGPMYMTAGADGKLVPNRSGCV